MDNHMDHMEISHMDKEHKKQKQKNKRKIRNEFETVVVRQNQKWSNNKINQN